MPDKLVYRVLAARGHENPPQVLHNHCKVMVCCPGMAAGPIEVRHLVCNARAYFASLIFVLAGAAPDEEHRLRAREFYLVIGPVPAEAGPHLRSETHLYFDPRQYLPPEIRMQTPLTYFARGIGRRQCAPCVAAFTDKVVRFGGLEALPPELAVVNVGVHGFTASATLTIASLWRLRRGQAPAELSRLMTALYCLMLGAACPGLIAYFPRDLARAIVGAARAAECAEAPWP